MTGRLGGVFARRSLSDDLRAHWDANGYLVLPEFFDVARIDAMNAVLDDEWATRRRSDNPLVIDVLDGPLADRRMYFRDVPDEARDHPYKLNDLYLARDDVRALTLDKGLARILRELVHGDIAICNSLHFERGSQQDYHFDTYYMPGPCADGLVVTSICLEDVHADAGPVTYYPGSHEIPGYRFSHGGVNAVPDEMSQAWTYAMEAVEARNLEAVDFLGRKGDVLIWHEQLYHGGREIRDRSRTRRSLVTHYWRSDVLDVPEGWALVPVDRHRGYLSRAHQPVV